MTTITATIVDAQGEVMRVLTVSSQEALVANTQQGETAIGGNCPAVPSYWDFVYQTWVTKPASPGVWAKWDSTVKSWQDLRTLADLKAAKNTEINTARLKANQSGFMYGGHLIATDTLSRSDIDAANGYIALNDAMPADWPGAWKADDNAYVPISDIATWKAFYSAMVAAGNTNFAKSQTLKTALAAATTADQVAAIVWPA